MLVPLVLPLQLCLVSLFDSPEAAGFVVEGKQVSVVDLTPVVEMVGLESVRESGLAQRHPSVVLEVLPLCFVGEALVELILT